MLPSAAILALLFLAIAFLPGRAFAQGETTSAIVGQVTDVTGAAVSGASVTITNQENGFKRSATSDSAGRFNFPQLKPGAYAVKVEAQGFQPKQDNVVSGLGQKQTVNFTLKVAQSEQSVEVTSEAPLINTATANNTTTLSAEALEDLPNPGGDLTYPLQFAAGALINTAGSGNDFVGGTNGYGNVEFNGLPALSNGYIVDGLETNDPLTNLNSGLSTNLVLGLNSISEVTVNTLSYAVDQGRYGASQVNYVTKSGTNQFHGNLYELWNGSLLNAADFFTNATPGNHKPRSNVNHFGGSLGGPIVHDKLFFFFDSEWVRIALPIVTPTRFPLRRFSNTFCSSCRWAERTPSPDRVYPPRRNWCRSIRRCSRCIGNTGGTPLAVLGCPFNADGSAGGGRSAERKWLRQPAEHFAFERRPRAGADGPHRPQHRREQHGLVPLSVRHRPAGCLHGPDQSAVQRDLVATALFVRGRIHTRVLAEPGELFQSGILLVREPVRAQRLCRRRSRPFRLCCRAAAPTRPSPPLGGLDNTWVQGRRATRFFINDNLAWSRGAHEFRVRHQHPHLPPERLRLRRGHGSHGDLHHPAAIHLRRRVHGDADFPAGGQRSRSTFSIWICMRRTPGR